MKVTLFSKVGYYHLVSITTPAGTILQQWRFEYWQAEQAANLYDLLQQLQASRKPRKKKAVSHSNGSATWRRTA